MPISGLNQELTFSEFLETLRFHQKKSNEEVRILAYLTDLAKEELYDSMTRFGFRTRKLGEIFEVVTHETKTHEFDNSATKEGFNKSIYYCYYDIVRSLLLCFTYDTLEEASKRMDRFAEQKIGITRVWIHPFTFDRIRRSIIEKNSDVIISEFHASRARRADDTVIRENYQRYFQYNGDDGRFTLDEICRSYGVLPNSIVFIIPNVAKFRITDKGRFTFIHGSMDILFDIINEILTEVLERKSIIDKAKIELIPVNFGKKEVILPNVIPINIVFSREVDYIEVEKMIDNMSGEDFNFEIFDMLFLQGSIHLSGTVFDKNKNVGFNITCNSDSITISPRKDTDFDSVLQFYKMVTERLDIDAHVELATEFAR